MNSRLAPAVLVAALLVATSAAFVVTEKLKLTRNPIVGPRVDKIFSPTCDCATDSATIAFRLRSPDRVSLQIIDADGDLVRELARDRPQGRGPVSYTWDGRDGDGRVVDEGTYRPRVHLDRQRRTIVMPNPIRVDVTPPRVESFTARPPVISPDGDGRFDRAKIRYRVSERSVVELYVDGTRALRRLGTRTTGTMDWFGVAGGEPLPQGRYTLRLVARDVAGQPRSAVRVADGRDPVPRARPRPRRDDPGVELRDPRALAGPNPPLDARRAVGRRPPGHPSAARPRRAGALRPPGRSERSRRTRRRGRPRGGRVSVASQIAGVVGALGLAVLLLAPGRPARIAGLVAWAAALGVLGLYLLPDLSRSRLVGGGARRPGRLARVRVGAPTMAVPARVRDARLHPAAPSGGHRERRGQPPAAALRGDRRARALPRVGARCAGTTARASWARWRGRSPRSSCGRASRCSGRSTSVVARSSSARSSCPSGCSRSASRACRGAVAG